MDVREEFSHNLIMVEVIEYLVAFRHETQMVFVREEVTEVRETADLQNTLRNLTLILTPEAVCERVDRQNCVDIGNGVLYCLVDGNPLIIMDDLHEKPWVSLAIEPSDSVKSLYPLVCAQFWYCGYRVYPLFYCSRGKCFLNLMRLGNVELPDSVRVREYANLKSLTVQIRSKIESAVFGYGIVAFYLVFRYETVDGFKSSDIEIPLWSWTYGGSVDLKEPYPIQVTYNHGVLYNCKRLDVHLCPWRGAWHAAVTCGIWEFWRWVANAIMSLIPQPVKDFMGLIGGLLSGAVAVLTFALNPLYLSMFVVFIALVFVLYMIHLLLTQGVTGFIEFYGTVKDFVGSVVDWILKLINTIKP